MKKIQLKILDKRLGNEFSLPASFQRRDRRGLDLRACLNEPMHLDPSQTQLISTGPAIHMMIRNLRCCDSPRSGLGHKHGMCRANVSRD